MVDLIYFLSTLQVMLNYFHMLGGGGGTLRSLSTRVYLPGLSFSVYGFIDLTKITGLREHWGGGGGLCCVML